MKNDLERIQFTKTRTKREYLGIRLRNAQDSHEENPPGSCTCRCRLAVWSKCRVGAEAALPVGPSCQLHASDESRAQVSQRPELSHQQRLPPCPWLRCCCSPAASAEGPGGCGFCQGPHSGSRHHWGLQWGKQCWALKAWRHWPGALGTPAATGAAGWALFYEAKQLLECAQSQGDLKFCDGFSEVLKQCRLANA